MGEKSFSVWKNTIFGVKFAITREFLPILNIFNREYFKLRFFSLTLTDLFSVLRQQKNYNPFNEG